MAEQITRPGTVEQFIKAQHPIRVSPEALEAFIEVLNQLAQQLTDKTVALAKSEGRQTLSAAHVKQAFQTSDLVGESGPALGPARLLKELDKMTNEQVADLVRLIQDRLASRPQ